MLDGYRVMMCPDNPWTKIIVTYDGRLFRCGCGNCRRIFKSKNLYKAIDSWNDYAELRGLVNDD